MSDPSSRPELKAHTAPIAEHETILLGFPIWWYTSPAIVKAFLEACDFIGKTIILFATSGESGLGRTAADLADSCPGAVIKSGKLLNGKLSDADLRHWTEIM